MSIVDLSKLKGEFLVDLSLLKGVSNVQSRPTPVKVSVHS